MNTNGVTHSTGQLGLPARSGSRPRTTAHTPHSQLDQLAPIGFQDRLRDYALGLPFVRRGASTVSVPGAVGFFLDKPMHPRLLPDLFAGEWGHIHPHDDGSLHLNVPTTEAERLIDLGWAEFHFVVSLGMAPPIVIMVYGPRDEHELTVTEQIVALSYVAAGGARVNAQGRQLALPDLDVPKLALPD